MHLSPDDIEYLIIRFNDGLKSLSEESKTLKASLGDKYYPLTSGD